MVIVSYAITTKFCFWQTPAGCESPISSLRDGGGVVIASCTSVHKGVVFRVSSMAVNNSTTLSGVDVDPVIQ